MGVIAGQERAGLEAMEGEDAGAFLKFCAFLCGGFLPNFTKYGIRGALASEEMTLCGIGVTVNIS
ncbi:hypothetical protein [Bartonella sp. CB178]|uniref:hypothetical protein n=1 Tax=Bartonella sp. CB178 TaxID=3112255 RepID=UPI00300DCFAF